MELDLHGRIFIITFFFSSFWIYIVLGDKGLACTNWKLEGGIDFYEGMVTVSYNGTTVNICAESFNASAQEKVCNSITRSGRYGSLKSTLRMYSGNLYGAKVERHAISYSRCINELKNDLSTIEHKDNCKVASLCCENNVLGPCTEDWKYYHNENVSFIDPISKTISLRHLTFDELGEYNFDRDVKKSWTRSALQEVEQCPTSNSSDNVYNGALKNCKKRCALTDDLSVVFLRVKNETCCVESNSSRYLQSDNCTVSILSVLPVDSTANVSYCIAAEVDNASLYVSIENCSLLFQRFGVPFIEEKESDKTSTNTSTIPGNMTTTRKTTKPSTTLPAASSTHTVAGIQKSVSAVIMAISICGPLLLLVIILFAAFILWKIKQSQGKREQQRPNSIINRTYNIEGPGYSYSDDGDYTLITDMEVEHASADSYIPPVPDRGDSKTDSKQEKSDQEVVVLGDYCTPSDQLRIGYKISQTSDYCMTTYDDPTRHKSTGSTENSSKRESIEKCSFESKEEQLHKRNSNTNSIILGRSSRNSEIWTVTNNLTTTTDLKRETNGKTTNTECKHEKAREEAGKINSIIQTSQNENSENHSVTLLKKEHVKTDGHFEIFTGLKSKQAKTDVKTDSDGSDYEDPSALGGTFQATKSSKPVLEEHVCLDCLKPEHLTKLGIKIISEEMYEKRNDIQRSRSDPSSQQCNCNSEIVDEEHASDKHKTQIQTATGTSKQDTLTELKVLRNKKCSACTRRCSVCHTVYDKLGIASQNAWANCTDNVYDQFGDFKHFQHRQNLCGKRINST